MNWIGWKKLKQVEKNWKSVNDPPMIRDGRVYFFILYIREYLPLSSIFRFPLKYFPLMNNKTVIYLNYNLS